MHNTDNNDNFCIYSMVLNICAIKYHEYYIMMSSWKVVLLNSVRLYVLL